MRGHPIAGASVCASGASLACCATDHCTTTDAQGRFTLSRRQGVSALVASATDHLSQRLELNPEREAAPFDFQLSTGEASISGVVQDASGGVIVEAWVAASSGEHGTSSSVAQSDSAGRFRLAVAPGEVSLVARAEGYSVARQTLTAPLDNVHLVLAPGSALAGRVVSEGTDAPVAGVSVTAVHADGLRTPLEPVLTDQDGEFRFESLPAGRYELLAVAPRWRGGAVSVSVAHGQVSDGVLVPVALAVTLSATVSVAGQSCQQGSVWARGPGLESSSVIAFGGAQLDGLLPGRYEVEVSCAPGVPAKEELEVGRNGITRSWDLQYGLELHGRVESPNGKPVAGIPVNVVPVIADGRSTSCVSDSQGQFACTGLEAGAYDCATFVANAPSEAVRVALDASSASQQLVLRSAPLATIVAAVSGVKRPASLRVFAENRDQLSMPLEGAARGDSFVFERLALGEYVVYAGTRASPSSARVSLTEDGQVANVTLPSPTRAALSGRVIDEQGEPVVDAWVRAFVSEPIFGGFQEAGPAVLTDGEGAFTFSELWRGRYDLEVSASSGEAGARDIDTGAASVLLRVETPSDRSARRSPETAGTE